MATGELHVHVAGLPAFKAMIERIRGLHTPTDEEAEFFHEADPSPYCLPTCTEQTCEGHTATVHVCRECGYDHDDGYPMFRVWPCPTITALVLVEEPTDD